MASSFFGPPLLWWGSTLALSLSWETVVGQGTLGLADPTRAFLSCVVPVCVCGSSSACLCVCPVCVPDPGVVWAQALLAGRPTRHPECPVPARAAVPREGPRPVPAAALCGLGGVWH